MTPGDTSAKLNTPLGPSVPQDAEGQASYNIYPYGNFDDISFMIEDGHNTRIDVY